MATLENVSLNSEKSNLISFKCQHSSRKFHELNSIKIQSKFIISFKWQRCKPIKFLKNSLKLALIKF